MRLPPRETWADWNEQDTRTRDARGRFTHSRIITEDEQYHITPEQYGVLNEAANHMIDAYIHASWTDDSGQIIRDHILLNGNLYHRADVEKYHCPPVPPNLHASRFIPLAAEHCKICPKWISISRKIFMMDILCRDYIIPNEMSISFECGESLRLITALKKDGESFTEIELALIEQSKLRLPHGGEMIL